MGTSDRKCHPLTCVTHRRLHFYFDPEKLLHPTLQTSHISPNLLENTVLLLFLSVFVILLGYVALFWQNLASSKPMSTISLCMGCCQVVCLTERLWPRLGAWLSRLGVTINCKGNVSSINANIIIVFLGYTCQKTISMNYTFRDCRSKVNITGLLGDLGTNKQHCKLSQIQLFFRLWRHR